MPPQTENNFFPTNNLLQQKPSRKYTSLIILVILLILTGIFGVWYFSNPLPEEESNGSTLLTTSKFADWKTYKNEQHWFEFKYPKDHTVYSKIDTQKESLVPANLQSNKITIAENEKLIFCCEPVTLNLFIANENITSREWIDKNYTKYTNQKEIKSIKDIKFAETNATELIAGGNLGSTYRLLVISQNGYILIINQNSESEFLDKILSTFKFSDQTANWKIYSNEHYGFEVKYMPEHTIKIVDNETGLFIVSFVDNKNKIYYKISVTEKTKTPKLSNFISNPEFYKEIKTYNLNGINWAVSWYLGGEGDGQNPISAHTIVGNNVYEIRLDADSQKSSTERIEKILSTFKFNNQTINWKTYKSGSRNFEVKYPPNMTAREIFSKDLIVCFEDENHNFSNELNVCVYDHSSGLLFVPAQGRVKINNPYAHQEEKSIIGDYVIISKDYDLFDKIVSTFKVFKY